VATEEELLERRREAERQAREARSQAARDAGHPEWADLPQNRSVARSLGASSYFTGRRCEAGHIAPKATRSQKCKTCAGVRNPVGRPRLRPVETRTRWARLFELAAAKTMHASVLHHVRGNGKVFRTTQKVEGDPSEAYREAARQTDATGKLHCVIYRGGRFLVRTVAD
jgi:hypothetical protein